MLDFRPGKEGCTTRCKWPYRKKGSVIVMYEVKSRCVETWFDGWEVRVRERQHVMGEITLSGVSHYGIRSMLSYVRSRQPLFEHRNPIPDYISRNDFEKFFFGDERDTYERIEKEPIRTEHIVETYRWNFSKGSNEFLSFERTKFDILPVRYDNSQSKTKREICILKQESSSAR